MLLHPSMILLVLFGIGLAMLFSKRWLTTGRWLLVLVAVGFVAAAFSPLPRIMALQLESRFPAQDFATLTEPPDGIIILGGAINSKVSRQRRIAALNEAGERFTVGVALALKFPTAKVLVSNGGGHRIDRNDPYGYAEYRLLESLGVNRARIIYERASSTTVENATMGFAVAQPKPGERWLLVTSAMHMPRAVGSFRAAGFDVIAWPVDYWTAGPRDWYRRFRKPSDGLQFADAVTREWMGLVYYRVRGWTDDLFPEA